MPDEEHAQSHVSQEQCLTVTLALGEWLGTHQGHGAGPSFLSHKEHKKQPPVYPRGFSGCLCEPTKVHELYHATVHPKLENSAGTQGNEVLQQRRKC